MSKMLEQAIVDASALREAALKNAETAIIEKYSKDIKDAVDVILEQELDLSDEVIEEEEAEDETADQLPLASTDCPDNGEDEVVTIDLPKLEAEMEKEMGEEGGLEPAEMTDREEVAGGLDSALQEDQKNDEIELNDEDITDLLETLTSDTEPVKSGWLESPTAEISRGEDGAEAAAESTEADEDKDEEQEDPINRDLPPRWAGDDLREAEEALVVVQKENIRLQKENEKFKSMALQLKDTLNEVNLQNAKMLYTNKTLTSDSLNERQKNKIAEAISKSNTVEEAKIIYETLQGTVGALSNKREPESLSEAVSRRSSTLLSRKREAKRTSDPIMERMQALAGIKSGN